MPTAKPLAATLEMVSVVPGVELASPAIRSSHQAEMVSPDMQRRRTLAAVEKHGGHAAGIILTPREKCRRFINSLRWQSGQLLACIVDMSMLFADISIEDLSFALIDTITGLVLTVFVVDLCLRVYTYRKMLLRSPIAYFDFSIVGLSLLLYFVGIAAEASSHVTSSRGAGAALRSLIIVLRWLRAARAFTILVKTSSAGSSAARNVTGENKKRYVDLEAGFDLDLAYVGSSNKLIAMSVPATGCVSLYRNPLPEVVRFLETRHGHEGYLIINCCPELPYPTDRFTSGRVECFDVQDHTPPTMAQFVEFLNHAAAAAQRGRLLAIHCRGGKGRTGCMCCAWLLYSNGASDADDALTLFALERTELGLGRRKLQGVDTPSQRRYVHQVAALLNAQGANYDGSPSPQPKASVQLPLRPHLSLRELELTRWFACQPEAHTLVCAVHTEMSWRPGPCFVTQWSEPVRVDNGSGQPPESVLFRLSGVQVCGDVRVSVFSLPALLEARERRVKMKEEPRLPFDRAASGPWGADAAPAAADGGGGGGGAGGGGGDAAPTKWTIAGKEPGCLFYFIFHTGFVGAAEQLSVPLNMMDRANKNKKGYYSEEGEATLRFATLPSSPNGSATSGEQPPSLGSEPASPRSSC